MRHHMLHKHIKSMYLQNSLMAAQLGKTIMSRAALPGPSLQPMQSMQSNSRTIHAPAFLIGSHWLPSPSSDTLKLSKSPMSPVFLTSRSKAITDATAVFKLQPSSAIPHSAAISSQVPLEQPKMQLIKEAQNFQLLAPTDLPSVSISGAKRILQPAVHQAGSPTYKYNGGQGHRVIPELRSTSSDVDLSPARQWHPRNISSKAPRNQEIGSGTNAHGRHRGRGLLWVSISRSLRDSVARWACFDLGCPSKCKSTAMQTKFKRKSDTSWRHRGVKRPVSSPSTL